MRNRSRSVALRSRRLSGGAGAWSPADLPGLVAWYTAGPTWCFTDAGGTVACGDGDSIYTWTDRSGNGYTLTQATLAYRPILYSLGGGLWVATFDGIDDYMDAAIGTLARPCTLAFRVALASIPDTYVCDAAANLNARLVKRQSDTSLRVGSTADVGFADVTTTDLAATNSFVVAFDNTNSVVNFNGTETGTTIGAAGSGLRIAAYGGAGGGYAQGDFYEVVAAAGAAGSADRAALIGYLTP